MARKFVFELDSKGVVALMKSEEMKELLGSFGKRVASSAGDGYESSPINSSDRSKVFVYADTSEAKQDNLKNNTLLKALGG